MASGLTLSRQKQRGPLISLVPMVDVMLILLVFFMVTSTYLNLDMIPAVRQQDQTGTTTAPDVQSTVLIRLAADGVPVINGQPHDPQTLAAYLTGRMQDTPLTQVMVLPSGSASVQALVSVMDIAANAGVSRMRVIRLEARP